MSSSHAFVAHLEAKRLDQVEHSAKTETGPPRRTRVVWYLRVDEHDVDWWGSLVGRGHGALAKRARGGLGVAVPAAAHGGGPWPARASPRRPPEQPHAPSCGATQYELPGWGAVFRVAMDWRGKVSRVSGIEDHTPQT